MSSDNKDMQFSADDFITKIDFTKGFSSYHIRWPVDKSLFTKTVTRSGLFNTAIKIGNETKNFKWCLMIEQQDDDTVWFGLYLAYGSAVFPNLIIRLVLCDGNNTPLWNVSRFVVFTATIGKTFSSEEVASFVGDNLEFHCWIEIPIDIKETTQKSCKGDCLAAGIPHLKGADDLFMDLSSLFASVLNEDGSSSDSFSDVTLNIMGKDSKVQRQFKCHRYILAARSPVFKTMFGNQQWKESGDNRSVEIKDIDASTMEFVLRYIYTGYVFPKDDNKNVDCKELLGVIDAAEKYMLPKLKDFCSSHLIDFAQSDDDRLEQFLIADRYQLSQLKAVSLASLISNPEGVNGEGIPLELFTELHKATAKRNTVVKEICVTEED